MKKYLLTLTVTTALLAGCNTDEKPSGQEQTLVEKRAEVSGIDQKNRRLVLKTDDGEIIELPVAAQFRDFNTLHTGDPVILSHKKITAWQVKSEGEAAPGINSHRSLNNPKPGEAPGGEIERSITITATITDFDVARGTVTLMGPQGLLETLKVKNADDLKRIRVGELVEITRSDIRALAVQSSGKK